MDAARFIILLGGAGIPGWVLPGASVDLNFATGQYFGGTLASLMSTSRASNKTDLLPSSASGAAFNTFGNNIPAITPGLGLLIEEARTNLFLNSTAPVTQTITLPATGSYTLWVNGSGSAAIAAGTATITGAGTATNGTPVVINCTVAGTITVTKTGALNAVQLEAGAFGTSLIVTAGASATRAADVVTATGLLDSTVKTASGASIITRFGPPSSPSGNFPNIIASGNSGIIFINGSNTGIQNNIGVGTAVSGSTMYGAGSSYAGVSYNASSVNLTLNGSAVASGSGAGNIPSSTIFLESSNGTAQFLDAYMARIAVFTTVLTGAALQVVP